MFIARRIDAIIIWPSLLQELIPGPDEARHFGSLEIDIPVFDDIPAFVACNAASPTHKQFIEQVNQLLSQSKSRIALFSSSLSFKHPTKDTILSFSLQPEWADL